MVGYKSSPEAEAISLTELECEYCLATKRPYPIIEMDFAHSWMPFRVRRYLIPFLFHRAGDTLTIIIRGIAAQ